MPVDREALRRSIQTEATPAVDSTGGGRARQSVDKDAEARPGSGTGRKEVESSSLRSVSVMA